MIRPSQRKKKGTVRMRLNWITAVTILMVSAVFTQTVSTMSHEETIVRETYARLSFAVQIEEIYKLTNEAAINNKSLDREEFATRLKNGALRFEISDFKAGDLSEISQRKYSDLVTKPEGGDALDIHAGTWDLATDKPSETHSSVATVRWHEQQNISENWEQPFGAIYPQTEVSGQHTRYAAFKVKATFQDRSIQYHAMFLFGKDKNGQEVVLPIDTVANLSGSSLNFFLKVPAYPETLIEGGVGKDPVIYDWLSSHQVSSPSGKPHEANCDLVALKCGVHVEDLKKLGKSSSNIRRPLAPGKARLLDASFHPSSSAFLPLLQATPDCTKFNNSTAPVDLAQANDLNHITGNHIFTSTKSTGCTYSNGSNSNGLCNTSCAAPITAIWSESGVVSSSCHQNAIDLKQGSANATGAGASCTGGAGGGVKACLFCQCNVTVSVTVSGATVTATSDGFFTAQDQINNSCAAQTQPTPTPTPTPTPAPPPPCGAACLPDPCLNSATTPILGGPTPDFSAPDCSPIIIDTTGKGFQLTSAADGVSFDIRGDGNPVQLGWTAIGSGNAFLALPGAGGVVTNGTQLFGNFTPQPASQRPNGFAALAVYDQPDHGGNNDGVIDAKDQIFSSLRLWIDENHDGICQPSELHTLPDLGVQSISLDYTLSHRVDEFGNVFRYRAKVNAGASGNSDVGRKAYDVFLNTK